MIPKIDFGNIAKLKNRTSACCSFCQNFPAELRIMLCYIKMVAQILLWIKFKQVVMNRYDGSFRHYLPHLRDETAE